MYNTSKPVLTNEEFDKIEAEKRKYIAKKVFYEDGESRVNNKFIIKASIIFFIIMFLSYSAYIYIGFKIIKYALIILFLFLISKMIIPMKRREDIK